MPVNPIINDRRNKPERRSGEAINQFPVITTQGFCIRNDRRNIPERRISKIVVKEWQVKESIFEAIFSANVTNK